MTDLIQIDKFPVKDALRILLQDKTTGENIIFATDMYSSYGYGERSQMTEAAILGFDSCDIQPRVLKAQSEQSARTRKKAEVFTPTWICNQMNNHCDDEWFGSENIFNKQDDKTRQTTSAPVPFENDKAWQKYIDSRRLEITCGEAPYIVSRYDAATGEPIPVKDRIGILDRKMRVVGENTQTEEMWFKWSVRAFQSVYGYEFQGDNLLIARINLLVTFCDYLYEKWGREATVKEIRKIANIISWNFWQMDGLTDTIPVGFPEENEHQFSFFDDETEEKNQPVFCKIYDWRKDISKLFKQIKDKNESGVNMKFDFVIGNPPYQDETVGENDRKPPLYHLFMDASYEIADVVELITPARFLFKAGQTPKQWNEKMLNDEHFKVLYYEADATKIFANTDIKGGICITLRNDNVNFGKIDTFTSYDELNLIIKKMKPYVQNNGLNQIISSQGLYKFSDVFFSEHPEAKEKMGAGTGSKIVSSIMEKLPNVFTDGNIEGQPTVRFLGRINNKRVYKYILRKYLYENKSIDSYNLFIPEANNSGKFGEILTEPTISYPGDGSADTFLSAGIFATETEPKNLAKYMKTKLFRALLGVKKVTQHCPPIVWQYVPLQDFTENSDIDWSKSVAEIDRQLYKKYNLSQEEINFIESHVKEMT